MTLAPRLPIPQPLGAGAGPMTNTLTALKDAWMFGVVGALGGFGIGVAAQFLDTTDSDASSILAMGAVGALAGGLIGETLGAMIVARNRGGVYRIAPIGLLSGAAGGMAWSKLRSNRTDVKGVIKAGLIGGITGATLGGAVDLLVKAGGN